MTIVTVGLHLAKNVFAAHGVDEAGQAVLVRPEAGFASPTPIEFAHFLPGQGAFWL